VAQKVTATVIKSYDKENDFYQYELFIDGLTILKTPVLSKLLVRLAKALLAS